jgi:hypothetical protein
MRSLFYILNLVYLAFVPALAVLIQGGLDHDFVLSFVSDGVSNFLKVISIFYVIVMVLMCSFLVERETNNRVLIGILLSGPLAGWLITLLTGGKPIHAIYNMYLIEGGGFILALIVQTMRHAKRIKEESGATAIVILPIFLLGFLGGFIRSINFEFLTSIYLGWSGYLVLIIALIMSFGSLLMILDRIDQEHGGSRFGSTRAWDKNAGKKPTGASAGPLILVAAIIGFLAYGFHEKLMEWEWLMRLLT